MVRMNAEDTFTAVLGEKKYGELVDDMLRTRLLPELYKRGQTYSDVRERLQNSEFKVEEEPSYIAPGFRAGKLHVTMPGADFDMFSFYRLAFSSAREEDVARDYVIANYLHEKGMSVPAVVFANRTLAVTGLIEGEELLKVLGRQDLRVQNTASKTFDVFYVEPLQEILDQVVRYHSLAITDKKVQNALKMKTGDDYYSPARFIEAVAPHNPVVRGENAAFDLGSLVDTFQDQWKAIIDVPLQTQERQGLIHNDLHCGNVIVSAAGKPVILDFGDATIGSVQYDLCRILMATGFFEYVENKRLDTLLCYSPTGKLDSSTPGKKQGNAAFEITTFPLEALLGQGEKANPSANVYRNFLVNELQKVFMAVPGVNSTLSSDVGYNYGEFYENCIRAQASIRLRLAGAAYKYLKKIQQDESYTHVLSNEEIAFIEGLPSHHITKCYTTLSKELDQEREYQIPTGRKISSFASDLAHNLATLLRQIEDKDNLRIEIFNPLYRSDYAARFNPDVEGLAMMRSINLKMGFVDREREVQRKDIEEIARRRKGSWIQRLRDVLG